MRRQTVFVLADERFMYIVFGARYPALMTTSADACHTDSTSEVIPKSFLSALSRSFDSIQIIRLTHGNPVQELKPTPRTLLTMGLGINYNDGRWERTGRSCSSWSDS